MTNNRKWIKIILFNNSIKMEEITKGTYKIARIDWYKRLFLILDIIKKTGIKWLLNKKDVLVQDVFSNKEIKIDYEILKNNWKFKYWYDKKEEALEQFKKLDDFYKN